MSDRLPYVIVRRYFDEKIAEMFSDVSKSFHGWEKQDFLDALYDEFHAQHEEETYDIALEAPSMIQ